MEGRASNFEQVLAHFKSSLEGAMYAAVDMELTGCDIPGEPDTYKESAGERLSKLCRIAERHVPIQLGLTLVSAEGEQYVCTTYNFYAFPHEGPEGDGISFQCRASALCFNAGHNIDFNAWIYEGVPYMTREDAARYQSSPRFSGDDDHERRMGLLRLWEALVEARVPLVVHTPLDLFFLLSCFERRQLPSDDPRSFSALTKQCFPCVFDTAYLHGSIGDFQNRSLTKFLEDARLRHERLQREGKTPPITFKLEGETAARYGQGRQYAHEAGYDSLATAQLYAYLIALAPEKVQESVNKLFLFKSTECLDLNRAEAQGVAGSNAFGPSREAPRVARVESPHGGSAVQIFTALGWESHRVDSTDVLVTIPAKDSDSDAAFEEVSSQLEGAVQWLSLEQWREDAEERRTVNKGGRSAELAASLRPRPPSPAEVRPASWAQQWLDGPTEPLRFTGAIKSFNPVNGFGFIDCPETFARFNRDVFLHHTQMGDCVLGQQVAFSSRGQPQARAVQALDSNYGMARWLLGELGQLKSKADVEDAEGLTTEVCSIGNMSDLESSKNGSSVSDPDPVAVSAH